MRSIRIFLTAIILSLGLMLIGCGGNGYSGPYSFTSTDTPLDFTMMMPVSSFLSATTTINALDHIIVTVDIYCDTPENIHLTLISSSGTSISLMEGAPGPFMGSSGTIVFDDLAANSISDASMILSGTYRPVEPLSTVAGEDPDGTWTLQASAGMMDTGTLNYWVIEIW